MANKTHSQSEKVSSVALCTAILALAIPLNGLQIQQPMRRGHFSPHQPPSLLAPMTTASMTTLSSPRRRQRFNAPLTTLHLLKGLVPSVDDDIRAELEEANLSPLDLFQRELSNGANIFQAYKTVSQRKKDQSGDYENKYKILSDFRAYSNRELLDTDHVFQAPTLDDLNQVQPSWSKVAWVTFPFRVGVFLSAFFSFPFFCNILGTLVEVSEDEFDIINDQFTPGIGILYGTFVALTLDILYERQGKVQENASVEASLLSQVTQNVISLFRDDWDIAREATQIIADQVRIIVYRSRGAEMLNIMRADPYARLLSLIDHYQRDKDSFTPQEEALIDGLRGEIPALMEARAKRLSDEASALPPTHFLVLLLLTALSLVGFTAATLTITNDEGKPPLESSMVFAGLTAVYVLFFNFCNDMNDPFEGVYQIKRSAAASYLLQIKWIVANQPYGKYIKFDTRGLAPVFDGNEVLEIGKGTTKVDVESLGLKERVDDSSAKFVDLQLEPMKKPVMGDGEEISQTLVMDHTAVVHKSTTHQSAAIMVPESDEVQNQPPIPEQSTAPTESERIESVASLEEQPEKPKITVNKSQESIRKGVLDHFQSTSGFGDKAEGEGSLSSNVSVPQNAANQMKDPRQISSAYFRSVGGFRN